MLLGTVFSSSKVLNFSAMVLDNKPKLKREIVNLFQIYISKYNSNQSIGGARSTGGGHRTGFPETRVQIYCIQDVSEGGCDWSIS